MPAREKDRLVLDTLLAHGANLAKPAHVRHYFYFPSLNAAEAAAAELRNRGYENLDVHLSPSLSLWRRIFGPREFSCIAETHTPLSEEQVFATSDEMTALVEKLAGDYDGCEASLER